MSHNPYHPYAPGNQNPTQGQYGLPNTQTERDPRRGSSFLGHGSIPSSSGAHFGIPENSGGMTSSSLNYRCDSSRMMRDEGASRSMDMHVGKAREEARLPVNPMHRHMEQDSPFTRIQRDEFRSSGTGMTSYPMASASSSHQAVTQSGNTNFNWLANCAGPSSGTKSTPALSNFARGDSGLFDTSSEGQNKMQAIPGLGDFQYPASGRSEVSAEPKYTSESAASILQRFGLEKGDLEHLISYPEDQITPANLPFILRKIRLEKDKKTTAGFQPTQTVTGPDSYSLGKASEMRIEETSSSVLQPSKVIDYGHTGKYTVGAGGDIGRKSDKDNTGGSRSLFLTDAAANRPNPEPLQKQTTDVKSSALGSSREQGSPFPSSSYSPASSSAAFPGNDQTKQLLTQPSPTYQNILSSFSFPKKDTAMGGLTSSASKPIPVKQPESDRQVTKVPVSSTSSHCRHPSRPGLVLIGSNDTSDSKDSSKTKGKTSAPTDHTKQQGKQKEQTKQQPMRQQQQQQQQQQKTLPAKSAPKQPSREQQSKQPQKKPVPQTRKVLPPTFGKSALPSAGISNQTKQLTSKKPQKDKLAASGDQPTPSMMFDYSATAPRVYPHTCSLCNKECTNMQDWISHQNSSLHLESCTRLRKQYPKWGGEIVLEPRAAAKEAKPSTSTSAKKLKRGSRSQSKSLSPHRQAGSAGRKDKRRSRSRSPQSSKHTRRYENPAPHRSQSLERGTSPKRKDDRQFSPRRTHDRRSPIRRSNESWSPTRRVDNRRSPPRRNTESWSPPRRVDNRRSPLRRGDERRSPPRRSTETWSPPRRGDERRSPLRRGDDRRSPMRRSTETWSPLKGSTETWSPPRRGDDRRSPLRRGDERRSPLRGSTETWSPPRRGDDRRSPLRSGDRWPPLRLSDNSRSPQRGSQERRSSREGSSPQRKGINSAESLAKKLMETTAVQSLSRPSDLEAVVKTLAPALLAELAKMTSTSPSPQPSAKRKKLSSASSSSLSSATKKEKGSVKLSSKPKHNPNEVELRNVAKIVSYPDLCTAVGRFGKTVDVKIYRGPHTATVQYQKVSDAEKLKLAGSVKANGIRIIVVQTAEKQKKTPLKKSATSSAQSTTTTARKVLLPTPSTPPLLGLNPGVAINPKVKPINQKAAVKASAKDSTKASAKGASGVNKAKVLVSKAKSISTKNITKKSPACKEKAVKAALAKAPEKKQVEKPVPLKTEAMSWAVPVKVVEPANTDDNDQAKDPSIKEKVLTSEKKQEEKPVPLETEATSGAVLVKVVEPANMDVANQTKDPSIKEEVLAPEKKQEEKPVPSKTEATSGVVLIEVVEPAKIDDNNQPKDPSSKGKVLAPEMKREERTVPLKTEATSEAVSIKVVEPANMDDANQTKDPSIKEEVLAPEKKQEAKPVPSKTEATSEAVSVKVVEPANMDNTNQTKDPLMEEKVIASQKPEASANTVMSEKAEETQPSTSEASGTKEQLPPEQSDKGSAVELKGAAEDDLVRDRMATEPEKVVVPQAEAIANKPEETTVKDTNVPLRPSNPDSSKPKQSHPKLQGSSDVQTDVAESGKASPPTMVKLHGVCSSLSHSEVVSAVECFGKTKSVVLFRARLEAVVIFEKVEDAKKLKSVKSLDVNGTEVMVVGEKEAVSKEPKTPPLKKPASLAPSLGKPTGVTAFTKGKVLAPVAKKVSTQQIIETKTSDSQKTVVVEQNTSLDPKSSESQPDAGESTQTAVEESVVVLTEKSEVSEQAKGAEITAETESVTQKLTIPVDELPVRETGTKVSAPDLQSDIEPPKLKEYDKVDAVEPMELEVTEVKVAEPGDAGIQEKSELPTSSNETQQKETSVVQEDPLSEPQSTAQGPETGTETSQPAAGNTDEAAVESTSTNDAFEAAAANEPKPTTSGQHPILDAFPTMGEMLETHLTPHQIYCWQSGTFPRGRRPGAKRQVLISGLPLFYDGFYTEGDVCNLLFPFGLQDKNWIYVIPQSCMALVTMPSLSVLYLLEESYTNGIYFRGIRLFVDVMLSPHPLTPLEFYKFMHKTIRNPKPANPQRIILIRNISWDEIKELRNALREFAPVLNFMPLLNKLFIEFVNISDACAFKSWHDQRFPSSHQLKWQRREILRLAQQSAASAKGASKAPAKVSAASAPPKKETATTSQTPGASGNQPESKSETTDTKTATEVMEKEESEAPGNQADKSETSDIKSATEVTEKEVTERETSEKQLESKPDKSETSDAEPATGALSNKATEMEATEVSGNQPEDKPDKSETSDAKPATGQLSNKATEMEATEVSGNQLDKSETSDIKPPSKEGTIKEATGNQPEPKSDKSETSDAKPATGALSNKATEKEATEASGNQPDKSATSDIKPTSKEVTQKEATGNQPEPKSDKSETPDTKSTTELPSNEVTEKEATEASGNQPDKSETSDIKPPSKEVTIKEATGNQPEPKPDKSETSDTKSATELPSNEATAESETQPESGDLKQKPQTSENGPEEPAVENNDTTNEVTCEPLESSVSAPEVENVSTFQEPQIEVGKPHQQLGESSQLNQTETKVLETVEVNEATAGSKDEAKLVKAEEPMELEERGVDAKAAASEQKKPSSSKESSSAVIRPTIGEMLGTHLFPNSIYCRPSWYLTATSPLRQLLISGLPLFHEGLYTEDDVADVLAPFGFENKADTLFVIPQSCMAFAMMPPEKSVFEIIREAETNGIYLQENQLLIEAVIVRSPLNAHKFYRFLKRRLKRSTDDEAEKTVFIRNISQSETKELRVALKEFAVVTNFMPLLNKLFIEFQTIADADRFEGWYRQLSPAPRSEVSRLMMPGSVTKSVSTNDPSPLDDPSLTHKEKFEKLLRKKNLGSLKGGTATSPKMLVTWQGDCCQTEDDLINLLNPFGYQHKDYNIYVFPQARLAFVQMQSTRDVIDAIAASQKNPWMMNGTELSVHALNDRVSLRPYWLYRNLMQLLKSPVTNERDRVIFIKNISASEFRDLREVLRKPDSVRNILLLLNKVFIEFKTSRDADWLAVWYSLLKKPPDHRIQRLKIPSSNGSCLAPKIPEDPYLDCEDVIEGATLPTGKYGVPHGSTSPFWLSLRNSPFVFPTISPWFIIPDYMTVWDKYGIERVSRHSSMCPTVMLTGLPEGDYKHEDVARLVWPFFPKQNLRSLFYNVTVLPLQRRAFVFFADWKTCCEFFKAHVDERISLKGHAISVHVVMQNMYPESSEETMYKSLMKLTNLGVPDPSTLGERLLCVGVSEVSLDVITLVIEMVASITTFVNFLPLANRILIEMSDSSGVAQVVEKYNDLSPNSFTEDPAWSKVERFETLESLRKRLEESDDVTLNLEVDTISDSSPEIDRTSLKSIKVTVGQRRLVEKSRSLSPQRTPRDDFTDDIVPSDAYLFDEEFNEEDFVTVDEVYDDADRSSERHRSTRSRSRSRSRSRRSSRRRGSRERREEYRRSSRSTKDTRSSSSSSSKPTKSSKSTTKPSSSSSSNKVATSSSPLPSTETPSSPSKSSTKHSEKTSKTTSSSEKANSKSAAETQPEHLSESAVPPSDHKVSAESSAPETVESETKMDARKEMHPPQQRQESDLSQSQDLDKDVKVSADKKQKKDKEDDKKTEEETTLDLSEDGGPAPEGGLEVKPEEFVEMEVLDSVKEDQDDSLASKQLLKEDGDTKTEEKSAEETNDTEGSDKADKQDSTSTKELKDQDQDQEELLQEGGSKNDLKESDSDVTEQAFEILDSIDDQNETDEGLKPKQVEGEEDEAYQVIDSVEDQPTISESEMEKRQQRSRRRDATAKKDDRPSRRSDVTNKAPKSSEKQTEAATAPQEKTEFEIVDSVEEEAPVRRRSTRGKKETTKPEEVTYEVLDSVETPNEEPAIATRSTRGRRGRASEELKTEDTPTKRRQAPARESGSREKTPKNEEKETKAATFQILDSVECVQEDPPATRAKGKRGRPKKQTKTAEKDDKNEEEATYQILDSVEDELADDQLRVEQTEKEKKEMVSENSDEQKNVPLAEEVEEETVFQVLDCLEDEQVQEEQAPAEEKTEAEEEKRAVLEASEQSLTKKNEENVDSPPVEASGNLEQTSLPPIRSQSVTVTLEGEKSPETQSPLVNLEKVSDEEEDYPDDTAEEEALRKRQAAAKQKQLTKAQRERRSRSREERGKVEVDSQELVTLDEVGADEAEDETPRTLVTVDEVVEEEQEEQSGVKPGTLGHEDQSVDELNQETLVTLDEAEFDEDEKKTKSAKRKHDDDTEESVNFVIVDEVKDEENKEQTPRTRGRPKKKPRQTPVRKSTRGKTESRVDEGGEEAADEPSSSSDKDPLKLSGDKQEVQETTSQTNVDAATAEAELEEKSQEEEGESRMDMKVASKQRREPVDPETKRSRSQSPSVPHDFLLPDFKPNNPLGKEFVVPGFFCNLCCVFYPNESTAKELHCSSQIHYNNLKRHYRKLQQKSRSSAPSGRESTSAGF